MRYSLLLLGLVGCASTQAAAPEAAPQAAAMQAPPEMMLSRAVEDAPQCFVTDTQRTVCPSHGKALPFSDDWQPDATANVANANGDGLRGPQCNAANQGIQCGPAVAPVAEDNPQP